MAPSTTSTSISTYLMSHGTLLVIIIIILILILIIIIIIIIVIVIIIIITGAEKTATDQVDKRVVRTFFTLYQRKLKVCSVLPTYIAKSGRCSLQKCSAQREQW